MRHRSSYFAIGVLLSVAGPAAGADSKINVRMTLPAGQQNREVVWALKAAGRIVAQGTLPPASESTIDVAIDTRNSKIPNGNATFLAAISQDEWKGFYPSFGEYGATVTGEVRRGSGEFPPIGESDWTLRTVSDPANILTVHYHRFDEEYSNPSLWTWDAEGSRIPPQNEIFSVGEDKFGPVFQIDTGLYGPVEGRKRIGLLPRANEDWAFKDGPDRFWSSSMGMDVHILSADEKIYVSRPDVSPKIVAACIDSPAKITVTLSKKVETSAAKSEFFTLKGPQDDPVAIASVRTVEVAKQSNHFELKLAKPLDLKTGPWTLSAEGFAESPVRPRDVLADAKYIDLKAELGPAYSKENTVFQVFAPTAQEMDLVLYDGAQGDAGRKAAAMEAGEHGIWKAAVEGDLNGKYYAYLPKGPYHAPEREVNDIYARCTSGKGGRAMIVDLRAADPPEFRPIQRPPDIVPTDAVVYEMHVRDFTISPSSGVSAKGKYVGLTEEGTRLPDDPTIKTGLDHLVELGVTHVQIMPFQDIDNNESDPNDYNWGYMTTHFNSPDGSYATSVSGDARIREVKRMVDALHKKGIRVIMDVVYNHASADAGFEELVPDYYYRKTDEGRFWNGSGCGNEFKTENPMAGKFVSDSTAYWIEEYGIDGYRFDLMGLMDLNTLKKIRSRLAEIAPGALLLGEPWTGGSSGLKLISDKNRLRQSGIAAFNDHFRDAIKGPVEGREPGFVQAGTRVDDIKKGIAAAIRDWAGSPEEVITYAECHDNLTLWDKLVLSASGASNASRERMVKLAGALVLTSQGIPFLQCGQEFCRTKKGNHNSYNAGDEINQIDWSLKKKYKDVFEYHKGLIALRKAHPVFRLTTAGDIKSRLVFASKPPSDKCVAYTLNGANLEGETWTEARLYFNGDEKPVETPIPEGGWIIYVNDRKAGVEPLGIAEGKLIIPGTSAIVLAR